MITVTVQEKVAPHQTIIERKRGWQLIDWQELFQYKDLFYFLVWRDVKVLYKQTILGFTWAVIRPFFSMIVFSVIFGELAKLPSDGVPYPIFSYAALVPWTYFSSAMLGSAGSLIGSGSMLSKVYFPRLVIPMTPVLGKLVDFAIAFVILGLIMLNGFVPTLNAYLFAFADAGSDVNRSGHGHVAVGYGHSIS